MRFAAGIGGTGERAYIGGTLSANPLSCVAGYYSLLEMERTNAPVVRRLREIGLQKAYKPSSKSMNSPSWHTIKDRSCISRHQCDVA